MNKMEVVFPRHLSFSAALRFSTFVCFALILPFTLQAAQRSWTGLGSDALWSTSANWDSGAPAATDTALFSGSGNGKTAVTLGNGATAAGLTFSQDAAAYALGLSSETLTLSADAALTLSAGSANSQSVAATLLVGGNLNVYNYEPSKSLTLNYTNSTSRNIYIYGSGPVTFDTLRRPAGSELSNNNTIELQLRSSASVTCTGPITLGDLWKDNTYPPSALILAPHTTNIICRDNWDFALSGCTISGGEGTVLRLARVQANVPAAIAVQTANPVTISCRLECPSGLATLNSGGGGWTRGTLILSYTDNLISNAVTIDRGNCFQVPFLAPNGTPNPLGSCTNFNFVNPSDSGVYARLRVTGSSSSSSDKAFTIDKDYGIIENAGSGSLTLTGPFTGAGTFAFDTLGDITLSGARSGTGGILKTGAGTMTMTAVNTHTGTNTISGGTLGLLPGASLGSGVLVLSGGTLSLNPGVSDSYAVTLPATTLADSSSLVIPDTATSSSVTISSLALNGCMLCIKAPSAGTAANRITITGLADGPVTGIVLNGGPATYSAASGLAPRTLSAVAVTDDTLPDSADSAATAATAPATSFSIASSLTTLGQFNYAAATPATLDLGGHILALNHLNASPSQLAVVNGTLTAAGAIANIDYANLRTVGIVPLTSDAATGLSTSKTYSHLLDFGNQSAATINGVAFTKGTATGTGTGYSGFPNGNTYVSWNSWTNNLPPETCAGLRTLLYDMNYAGNWTGQLTGLTPGAIYEITLYFRAWDAPPSTQERRSLYQFYSTSSSQPDTAIIYASQPNSANAIIYRYMAPASGTVKIAVTAVATSGNTASGCFGLANERLAAASATPPTSGFLYLAGPLSISAALADNGAPTALTAVGPDTLTLSGPVSLTGSARFDAPLTLAPGSAVTQAFNGPVSGNASIALNGAGRVIFNTANPALNGPVTVSNGVLEIAHSQSLGASAQPTVAVEAGGSLAIGQAANNSVVLPKTVTIAGNGPDGLGALRFDYDALQYNAFSSVALTSDAAVGGNAPSPLPCNGARGRFDIRSGTLDFGGHTLSKVGSSAFIISASRVAGVTQDAAIDVKGGVLGLETTSDLKGSATNTLAVRSGAALDLYQLSLPVSWSVTFGDQAHLSSRGHTATNQNILVGHVTLLGTAILDGTSFDTISGSISGTGGLFKAQGYTRLSAITNTYSGPTTITNGVLYALADTTLSAGNYASVSVISNGTLVVRPAGSSASQPGWSDASIGSLATSGAFARTAALGFETLYADHIYSGPLPVAGIAKYGTQKETITASGDLGPISVNEGELYFTTAPHNIGTNSITVCLDSSITSVSTVHVATASSLVASDYGYNKSGPLVSIAAANATRGVLCLDDGGAVAGRLYLGGGYNNAQGAVYQTGGTFLSTAGTSNDGRLGANGFGYYEISGGTFTTKGYTQLGYNTNTVGIIRQTGGSIIFNSGTAPATGVVGDYYGGNFAVRAGYGLFHLAGGTFNTGTTKLSLGEWDGVYTYSNGVGVLTMENDAYASTYYLEMANRNGSPLSVANLNGGTLAARYLVKGGNNYPSNATALVSFNGGNLRLTDGGAAIRTGSNNTAPVLAVCTNGASIEVDAAATVTLDLPLDPPLGSGVTFVGLSGAGAGYIAPPFVNIAGGGGTGATAVATLDRSSGTLTGVRVTSPGFGYTNSPTVTLIGGGYTTAAVVRDVVIGPTPATGGLTKRGNGFLTLTTNNSFRGSITVAGGTLAARAPSAIPQGANLVLNGGTLDLGGRVLTNSSVTLAGGSLINGSVVTATLNKNDSGSADLTAGITLAPVALNAANGTPGLYEGRLANYLNRTEANPRWSIQLTTRAYNGTNALSGGTINGCLWPDNTCYVYSGYLWNRAATNVTWTFGENFDDSVYLVIDGSTILNESGAAIPSYRNVLLTPGPHAIEVRCGQSTSTVGGNWVYSNSTYRVGFGVDFQGRAQNIANNYQPLTDPGDGSLLTTDLPACYTNATVASAANLPSLPTEIATNVGGLATGYALVYASDIPSSGGIINGSVAGTRYSTDTSLTNTNDFDRVAYYVELTHPTYGNQWVWVSFDAVTRDRTRIGYPWHDYTAGSNYCANIFQRKVSSMDVRSNVSTITNYTGCATGNIEFWPNDYGQADTLGLGASSTNQNSGYDFGDTMSSAPASVPSHGSFQVHNWGDKTTLFAMDNWGKNNNTISLGIGNQPGSSTGTSLAPDWTFNYNGTAYTYRRLYVLTRDIVRTPKSTSATVAEGTLRVTPTTITHPVPSAIRAKVGSAADSYDVVYGSAVPTIADTIVAGTAYGIDNSADTNAFDRVAYYLELVNSSAVTQYVWVAFDPQTQSRKKLGYPSQSSNLFLWQQKVANMDVVCNVSGVINYTACATGNIEIWPSNYSPGTSALGLGGNGSTFDYDDSGANATQNGHGCFQIHNWGDKTTLLSISHLGTNGNAIGVGIGNNPNPSQVAGQTDPDYTFTYNATSYVARTFYVLVRPTTRGTGTTLAATDLSIAAGATLDLGGATQAVHSVTGSGTVSNGVLAASIISPAGDGVVGTLDFSGVQLVPGTQYRADLGDLLNVTGSLDVSGMVLHINNPAALVRSQTYTLIQTTEGVTGALPALDTPLPSGWKVLRRNNALMLLAESGTTLKLR